MSDKLIEAFLQMHNKKQIEEKASPAIIAADKKRNPNKGETLGNIVKSVIPGVDAAIKAKEGDYAGAAKSAAFDVGATLAGGAIGKGLGSAFRYGSKLLGYGDDAAKAVTSGTKALDGEITTASPKPGYKDITPSTSTAVARTSSDVATTARPTGPSSALSRPNSSSVGPAMRTVDDVPPRLTGPTAARALPSASDTSKALGGFSKVPMGKVAAVGAGVGAGIAASTLGSSPAGETKAAPAPETPKPESYKVSKGDTLSDLAKKWNVSVGDIAKANQGIKDVHKIGIGQELVKPTATGNKIYQNNIGTKSGPSLSQNLQKPKLKAESTEMTNKLIDAFMQLHSTNSSNLFTEAKKAKKLDPVGKEDEDIDNDGDKDKSDSYLHNRRKAIKAAMKEAKDPYGENDGGVHKIPPREMTPEEKPKKLKPSEMKTDASKKETTVYKQQAEEVEQIDESLSAAHKAAIAKHVGKMWGKKGNISFNKEGGKHFVSHSDGIETHVHSIDMKKGVPHVTHFMTMQEEVQFSEAELEHIAAILEANPIAPVPDDYSGAAGGVSKRDLSDETVAEEEMKRGRGRPKGSKSGSKHGAGGDSTVETKNLASQIRFSRPSGGNFMLKHPTTGVTKAVPAKAATEFYNKYTGSEKPAQKQAHHDEFLAKHFGSSEKKKTSGISLPKIPAPKS